MGYIGRVAIFLLTHFEKEFCPEHSSVAKVLKYMALLYRRVGRNKEVDLSEKCAIAISR